MDEPDNWRRISTRQVADCRVFAVREDICENSVNGRRSEFYVIEVPDWVNVIARTPDGSLIMIEQFRHGIDGIITEIPGGMVDEGEEPLDTARRELLEETGYASDDWVLLGRSRPNPAIQGNWVYHCLANNCRRMAPPAFDENESIATRVTTRAETAAMIADGSISHSLVVAAFYYFDKYLQNENSTS